MWLLLVPLGAAQSAADCTATLREALIAGLDLSPGRQACPARTAELRDELGLGVHESAIHVLNTRDVPAGVSACLQHTAAATAALLPHEAVVELDGRWFLYGGRGHGALLEEAVLPGPCSGDASPCPVDQQGSADVQELLSVWMSQRTWAQCTGVLVEEGRLLTANHCNDSIHTGDVAVFTPLRDAVPVRDCKVALGQILSCDTTQATPLTVAVLSTRRAVDASADLALWEVTGNVLPEPIGRDRLATGAVGDESAYVYSLGYPLGLPLKLSRDGQLQPAAAGQVDVRIDAFAGSSGSPIYRCDDNRLAGLLVAGVPDFTCEGDCLIFADYRNSTPMQVERMAPAEDIQRFYEQTYGAP